MYAALVLLFGVVGGTMGYYPQRQEPYNTGPNDPYVAAVAFKPNFLAEPSQRLFWGNGQGSNQVGGTGVWAMLTNKFPFLQNMFGRMELEPEYGIPAPNQVSYQYGPPQQYQPQNYPQFYQQPQQNYQQPQQNYQQPQQNYQQPQQNYQPPQFFNQVPRFRQGVPARDVGFTDDAVIVTPPQVPAIPPQFPAAPPQVPVAPPQAPQPAPEPSPGGYQYNKPQYRLELPYK